MMKGISCTPGYHVQQKKAGGWTEEGEMELGVTVFVLSSDCYM